MHMTILGRVPFYTDTLCHKYPAPAPIYQKIEYMLLAFEYTETAL